MRTVELLLRENVQDLGRCGDVVKVAAGYARNYLLPRKLAVTATEDNKRAMARRAKRLAAEEAVRAGEIEELIASLGKLVVRTVQRADEQGHLYGSVSAGLIAELATKAGYAFEEKAVRLETPIKSVGTHTVAVHVHGDQHAEIKVEVEAEA